MKKHILFLVFTAMVFAVEGQQLPKVSAGSIQRVENFPSQFLTARNVDIWLPEGYQSSKKYPVVYIHDGQMLFDSTLTWNKKEWKVDEILTGLIREQKIGACIVVGIWNTGMDRISEYLPTKIFNLLDDKTGKNLSDKYCNGKGARGDQYLKFIVTELKPYVDKNFATFPDREHTFMAGSSMGGLISI